MSRRGTRALTKSWIKDRSVSIRVFALSRRTSKGAHAKQLPLKEGALLSPMLMLYTLGSMARLEVLAACLGTSGGFGVQGLRLWGLLFAVSGGRSSIPRKVVHLHESSAVDSRASFTTPPKFLVPASPT